MARRLPCAIRLPWMAPKEVPVESSDPRRSGLPSGGVLKLLSYSKAAWHESSASLVTACAAAQPQPAALSCAQETLPAGPVLLRPIQTAPLMHAGCIAVCGPNSCVWLSRLHR